jgi:hypothetical protein
VKVKQKVGNLKVAQIRFIEEKVRELGSIERVREFYRKRDKVGEFGRRYGEWVYRPRD